MADVLTHKPRESREPYEPPKIEEFDPGQKLEDAIRDLEEAGRIVEQMRAGLERINRELGMVLGALDLKAEAETRKHE